MRLLHCRECFDVVALFHDWRACRCGRSEGRYLAARTVLLRGPCRALEIDGSELHRGREGTWRESEGALVAVPREWASG